MTGRANFAWLFRVRLRMITAAGAIMHACDTTCGGNQAPEG
jgi:hypothetical protein